MLQPGSRIGQYEILSSLGAGGMGDVYRARDPRLDRTVAIKVLSTQLAGDPAAIARFEREAMSVAKLSHPNILSIFEFVRDGSSSFVVTELVDGETLRSRLDAGALPQRRAVAYALQIARGIAAAHARGIVHRDLKPENVMITRDDQVKILDFGLAKPVDMGPSDATRGPSVATGAGLVLGTLGYMAPEQVRGLPVDHRTDVFSFGAVLYEMLSGVRAFRADTAADTMSAILSQDPPDLDVTRLAISPAIDRIVRRCLEKNPELRFQSANDLAFALETLSNATSSAAVTIDDTARPMRPRGAWLPWTIAAAAVLAAAASWIPRAQPPAEPAFSRFTRLTETAGEETGPTISPDGSTVAYSTRVNGSWDIYSQRVGGRNASPVVAEPGRDERGAAFSPDGSLLAFHESDALGGIFVAGATGESVRRVTDAGFDPAWSPDGTQIAFATEEIGDPSSRLGQSTLYVVPAGGGAPRKLADTDGVQPSFSPSGDRIVYWSNTGGQRDIYVIPTAGGQPIAVTNDAAIDWCPVWSPDGHFIYFSSDRGGAMNVWRVAVDASGHPSSPPEPVTSGVHGSSAVPRFSKDGTRFAFRSRIASVNPVAIPLDPSTLRAGTPVLLDTQNNTRLPSDVSPDGKLIAYFSIGERQEDIFVGPPGGPIRRITDDAPRDRGPTFTPDGRSLVFYSSREGQWGVWMVGLDGGGLQKLIIPSGGAVYPFISPKGDRIAYIGDDGRSAFTIPFAPGKTVEPTVLAGGTVDGKYFTPSGWSRDGARIAGYVVADSGRPAGVAVYEVATKKAILLSSDEAYAVKWLDGDRRMIYFTHRGQDLVVIDTVTGTRTRVDVRLPAPSTDDLFAVSPDGRTIFYGAARAEADIWIVERTAAPPHDH
jgi:serine/threonine protein kinase/Tol biopolymer transport system component